MPACDRANLLREIVDYRRLGWQSNLAQAEQRLVYLEQDMVSIERDLADAMRV